jgi:nucleoside-triphosphatase THEP1
MNCTVTKQHHPTADQDGIEIWDRTNAYQKIREIEYSRRRKKYENLTDEELATYESCDGHHHYRHYGRVAPRMVQGSWGRHVVDLSFTETVIGFCPRYADLHSSEVEHSKMFAADVLSPWMKLKVAEADAAAFTSAQKFYSSVMRGLIITGQCGFGKTTLARAVMDDCRKAGDNPYFISCEKMTEVFLLAQPSSNGLDVDARQAMLDMKAADLLVIDDLGTAEKEYSEFFKEKLKMVLDERKNKIVVTTNLDRGQLESKFNDKIVSRIFEKAKAIHLKGRDYRRGA